MIIYDNRKWWQQLFSFDYTILPSLFARLSFFIAYGLMITMLYKLGMRTPVIPSFVHNIIGTCTGILLVFRTTASYDRYWEGRKAWGAIINSLRFLFAAAQAAGPRALSHVTPLIFAFPITLKNHLRGERNFRELKDHLDDITISKLATSQSAPLVVGNLILDWINTQRTCGVVPSSAADAMYRAAHVVIDAQGACERIKRTPLPFAYVVHIQQMITLYLLTVPFAMIETFGWWTPVAVFLIGFAFMGIEDAGIEIEDPFGSDGADLPLQRFCETIASDVRDLVTFRSECPQAFGRGAARNPPPPNTPSGKLSTPSFDAQMAQNLFYQKMHQQQRMPQQRRCMSLEFESAASKAEEAGHKPPGQTYSSADANRQNSAELEDHTVPQSPPNLPYFDYPTPLRHNFGLRIEPPDESDDESEPGVFLSHVSKLSSEVSGSIAVEILADRTCDAVQKKFQEAPKQKGEKIVVF